MIIINIINVITDINLENNNTSINIFFSQYNIMPSTRTRSYRKRRLRSSPCRKMKLKKGCTKRKNCSWASGRSRRFCRRKSNRRR